jgi:hypothetical protein
MLNYDAAAFLLNKEPPKLREIDNVSLIENKAAFVPLFQHSLGRTGTNLL